MPEEIILRAEGLCKRFGTREALNNVSLTLQKGETAAVIGRSGSGKSTLLRCLAELERVEKGRIEIAGEVMADMAKGGYAPEKKLRDIRRRMGYVFQDFNLFPHFSVLRNLTEAQVRVLRRPRAEAKETALAQLARMGLDDRAADYPYQLSGGQKQRVAIARALCMRPDILCFDEPTSALDPLLTQEVLQVIRQLAREGRSMLVVTHEMAFARDVAARVHYMEEGEIVLSGTPETVFASPRVRLFSGAEEKAGD